MQRILLFSLFAMMMSSVNAQQSLADLGEIKAGGDWMYIEADVNQTPQAYLTTYKSDLGLSAEDDFSQTKVEKDNLGFSHFRYNQTNKGIPVEGAQYLVHVLDGKISRSNGKLVRDIKAPTEALISSETAIESALLYVDADGYYWESEQKEHLIKHIKRDEQATFYPSPELVYADKDYSQDGSRYRLAWKMDIYPLGPKGHQTIFVDAKDGHILYTLDQCQDVTVDGLAETRYHGLQTFQVDSLAPDSFRLYDDSRAATVETYNMQTKDADFVPDSAVDFIDSDNYWEGHNEAADDAATDVHWGMQKTYDYFADEHGRISFDGDTSPVISFVHVRRNWFNARWTGMWAEFGDGSGDPLTSLDIVSHELTHGVTGTSSGLVYRNESGALNESFSDIFGVAVEWAATPDSADWFMGRLDFQFRSIKDPGAFGDPDTYLGDNWHTDDSDNGGVHTNSGVQNFWYYLLSMGGSGNNDNGDAYEVTGIGMKKAEAIAFRNLTTYLTNSSTYEDARYGAILSAEDLYGPCSEEVLQTIEAWYAVGVGPAMTLLDYEVLAPEIEQSSCSYSSNESVSLEVLFRRSGCADTLMAGTRIPVGYSLNGEITYDTITLTEDFVSGDQLTHTFDMFVDLSNPAFYDFDFFIDIPGDENDNNDELSDFTLTSVKTLDTTELIGFNWFTRPPVPPYFTTVGEHAEATTSRIAASTGFRGFIFTGLQVQRSGIDPPTTEEENFTKNFDYESRLCMCIDASDYDSVAVEFDLRQGYAGAYELLTTSPIERPELAIALRLLADEIPVSKQFHPDSIIVDTFVRQRVDLSQLGGSSFNLCFQGKHYFSRTDDFANGGEGDYSHIDDLEVIFSANNSGVRNNNALNEFISIYPNPTTTNLFIDLATDLGSVEYVRIIDASGRIVNNISQSGDLTLEINTTDLSTGLYFVEILTAKGRVVEKLLVN